MTILDELLSAICAAPDLPGARCKGQWAIWDATDEPELLEYCTYQCQSCPALQACESWYLSLQPSKRPRGVVAGRRTKDAA